MVEWDQRALATTSVRSLSAQSTRVRSPDQLRPESMYSLGKCFRKRVCDVLEKRRILREVRQRERFELQTFAPEIAVHEVDNGLLGYVRGGVAGACHQRVEIRQNRLGRRIRGLVHESLRVRVYRGNIPLSAGGIPRRRFCLDTMPEREAKALVKARRWTMGWSALAQRWIA